MRDGSGIIGLQRVQGGLVVDDDVVVLIGVAELKADFHFVDRLASPALQLIVHEVDGLLRVAEIGVADGEPPLLFLRAVGGILGENLRLFLRGGILERAFVVLRIADSHVASGVAPRQSAYVSGYVYPVHAGNGLVFRRHPSLALGELLAGVSARAVPARAHAVKIHPVELSVRIFKQIIHPGKEPVPFLRGGLRLVRRGRFPLPVRVDADDRVSPPHQFDAEGSLRFLRPLNAGDDEYEGHRVLRGCALRLIDIRRAPALDARLLIQSLAFAGNGDRLDGLGIHAVTIEIRLHHTAEQSSC